MLEIKAGRSPSSPASRRSWRRTRSRRSAGSSALRTGSSIAAGAASRTGSRGATGTSGSGPRTRPRIRTQESWPCIRAGRARRSCSSPTATAISRARPGALGQPLRDRRRGPGEPEGAGADDAVGGRPADLAPRGPKSQVTDCYLAVRCRRERSGTPTPETWSSTASGGRRRKATSRRTGAVVGPRWILLIMWMSSRTRS